MKITYYCLLILMFTACSKEDIITKTPPQSQKFGDLQIEVLKCEDSPECNLTAPLFGTNVYIYNTIEDQELLRNVARTGQTDVNGQIKFTSLDSFIVYISVVNDSFINKSFELVPYNSTSFHSVHFN